MFGIVAGTICSFYRNQSWTLFVYCIDRLVCEPIVFLIFKITTNSFTRGISQHLYIRRITSTVLTGDKFVTHLKLTATRVPQTPALVNSVNYGQRYRLPFEPRD